MPCSLPLPPFPPVSDFFSVSPHFTYALLFLLLFHSDSLVPFSFLGDSYFGNFGSFFMDFQFLCQLWLGGVKARSQELLSPFDSSRKSKQAQHNELTGQKGIDSSPSGTVS